MDHSASKVSPFPATAPEPPVIDRWTFEGFTLDRQSGQLTRDGESVPLAPQPFKLLDYFVSHPGRLISRDELQEQVWGSNTFVDFDRGLNFCILQIRTALGDDAKAPRFIETVPRRGYRFIATVTPSEDGARPSAGSREAGERSRWSALAIVAASLVLLAIAVLAINDDLAARLLSALRIAPVRQAAPVNAAAHDAYLRARSLWNQRATPQVRESIVHYRNALGHEPRFGLAWVGIAESYHLLQMRNRVTPAEARAEIGRAVEAALRVEPSLASAHAAAGTLAFWYDWKWDEAERHFRRALTLDAGDAGAHHDYGWLLIARGRTEEGLAEIVRAQQLDPISPRAMIDVAWAAIYMGNFDRAIAEARRTLELNPEFEEAYRCMEHAYLMKGDFEGALDAARHRMTALGRTDDLAAIEGLAPRDAMLELRRIRLRRFEQQAATAWVDPYDPAAEHAFLGDKEKALELLEKAIGARSTTVPLMAADPMLRSLHGDPRFERMLRALRVR